MSVGGCDDEGVVATQGAECVTTAPTPSVSAVGRDDGGVVATQGTECVTTAPTPSVSVGGCDDEGVVATQFPGRRLDGVAKYQGNHVPHWTKGGAIYHISFRLADSVPVAKRQEWEECRKQFAEKKRTGMVLTDDEIRQMKYLYSANVEAYLDSGYGACILRNDGAFAVVRETLLHDNGTRYRIHAFGVMPNHVHVIVEFFDSTMMAKVLQQWKSVSAHRLNRILHRKGDVWQIDSYNHIIRTAEEYAYQMNYVYVKNAVVGAWRRGCVVGCDNEGVVATQLL